MPPAPPKSSHPQLCPGKELDPAPGMLLHRCCSCLQSCWGGQDLGLSPGRGFVLITSKSCYFSQKEIKLQLQLTV